ncbi:hypothetical protein D3C76_1658480 [compost metagenome]
MKVLGAVILYLFISGVMLGGIMGDRIRCGNGMTSGEALAMSAALPMAFGAVITSGKLPPYEECKTPKP